MQNPHSHDHLFDSFGGKSSFSIVHFTPPMLDLRVLEYLHAVITSLTSKRYLSLQYAVS